MDIQAIFYFISNCLNEMYLLFINSLMIEQTNIQTNVPEVSGITTAFSYFSTAPCISYTHYLNMTALSAASTLLFEGKYCWFEILKISPRAHVNLWNNVTSRCWNHFLRFFLMVSCYQFNYFNIKFSMLTYLGTNLISLIKFRFI